MSIVEKTPDCDGKGGAANATDSPYIPADHLHHLKTYRYSGTDYSIMSYHMQGFWNYVVTLFPRSTAPNRITFTGFVIGMSSTCVTMYYYFVHNAEYPSWVWYYAAVSLFVYQTLDAVDGKQARRTGTGSPLGELFDHGCDAFLTPFLQLNVAMAVNPMADSVTLGYVTLSSIALFAAIFEQYCTGVLDLGYVSGPTEGILILCGLFIFTGRYSVRAYDWSIVGPYTVEIPYFLTAFLSPHPVILCIESLRSCLFLFFGLSSLITAATNLLHVLRHPSIHRHRLAPWIAGVPVMSLCALHIMLYQAYPDVHQAYPFVFELSLGWFVSSTVTRLTISRLCALPYSPFTGLYIANFVVTVGALAARYEIIAGYAMVRRYLGPALTVLVLLAALHYSHMVYCVFRQLARYLRINIMSI